MQIHERKNFGAILSPSARLSSCIYGRRMGPSKETGYYQSLHCLSAGLTIASPSLHPKAL